MSDSTFRVSGKKFELEASAGWKLVRRPGGWIIAEGPGGERRRLAVFEDRGRLSASVGGRLLSGEILAKERRTVGATGELVAQFPGKVRKVLVAAGDQVQDGQGLVLIEAMKMEFAVSAPGPGKIKKVLVHEGQQLSPGDRFVEFVENG
jgi:3-methylcrotonyl-CoA carboxylase alpha subunit